MTAPPMEPTVRERRGIRGTLSDIYHERTRFDFIGRSRLWFAVSGLLVTIAAAALIIGGLNLGIDFEGGTQWEVKLSQGTAAATDVRDALTGTRATNAKVLILGSDAVRIQAPTLTAAQQDQVTAALAKYAGVPTNSVSISTVGPTWGDQVSRKALTALIFFFVLIAAYLTFRFEWRMAVGAIVAVLHDIVITVGVYAVTRFEVTPGTVVAFLTILGFSLYDTVVVFDKVHENTPGLGSERGDTYSNMVNRSMNQVLMRSLNTTFVALLPVASLLIVGSGILGAVTLRDFALALFVGLFVGTYSSIFVATPILALLKEREPRYAGLRERAATYAARGAALPSALPAPTGALTSSSATVPEDGTPSSSPPPLTPRGPASSPVAPRPRQQRRRKRR